MMETKIIHISDLHICKKNYTKVFNLFADITRYNKIEEFYIIITGDFTDDNTLENIKLAKELLNILLNAKGIYITPGNHDYFRFFGNGFFDCKDCKDRFNEYFLKNIAFPDSTILNENIAIIGINSAHPDFFATGKIGENQLEKLETILNIESIMKSRLRIVYLHHHVFDLSLKWYQIYKKFMNNLMQLEDSKKLLKILKKNNVNIVLNGHRHSRLGKKTKKGILFLNGGSSSGKECRKGVSLIIIGKNNEVEYQERWNYLQEEK